MPKKTNVPTRAVPARFAPPPKYDPATLVSTMKAQVAAVMACVDYPNQPVVQGIVKTTQADLADLDTTLAALAKARAAIPPLEAQRNAKVADLRRDRHNLAGALTQICGGDPVKIKEWGAVPGIGTPLPDSTDAPTELTVSSATSLPGTVRGKCARVNGAASYLWLLVADPNAPTANLAPIVTTGCKVIIANQAVGHVMYLRAAVVRRHGGQSAWSDAVQVTVR